MHIQINKITPIYKNELAEPIGAEVSYNLILVDNPPSTSGIYLKSDSKLIGVIIIYNSDPNIGNNVMNWTLWEFSQYIFKNIMKGF